jgi:hypothetical protein
MPIRQVVIPKRVFSLRHADHCFEAAVSEEVLCVLCYVEEKEVSEYLPPIPRPFLSARGDRNGYTPIRSGEGSTGRASLSIFPCAPAVRLST